VVLAPNWLGDAVMALPAIADVRARAGRLTVAARSGIADLFRLVPGVDEVIELRWKGRWLRRAEFRGDAARLADAGADLAILLPNSFATALLAQQAGVAERWGYATDMRGPLLTRTVKRPRGSLNQGAYYQHLTAALGIAPGPLHPKLTVPAPAIEAARQLLTDRGWHRGRPLVVLAPGAAYGTAKRWIPAHVAALASTLVRERHATCVLVGSRADRATTEMVRGLMEADAAAGAIDVAGETTLEALAAIFALAQVCVCNDSGAMHVAAAVGTPVVAVFGPTRERETAPLTGPQGVAEVVTHPVFCRPCMLRECPIDHRCMTRITPDRVFQSVDRLMAGAVR
jgi:heptosyltransferase-2